MKAGIYIGKRADLKGERALVRDNPGSEDGGLLAQFDSRHHQESIGWWAFPAQDFKMEAVCPDE